MRFAGNTLAALLALTCTVALIGCPPTRPDVENGTGGGEMLQSAFFALESYQPAEYQYGYLWMVDTDYTCQQIQYDYGLAWWSLASDIRFVQLTVVKGANFEFDGMEFRSRYAWDAEGTYDWYNADYFEGSHGTGGYGSGTDGEDVPPPVGRDVVGQFGADVLHADDTLRFLQFDSDRVRGNLQSVEGDYSFDAVNCGFLGGGAIGGGDDGSDPTTGAVPG